MPRTASASVRDTVTGAGRFVGSVPDPEEHRVAGELDRVAMIAAGLVGEQADRVPRLRLERPAGDRLDRSAGGASGCDRNARGRGQEGQGGERAGVADPTESRGGVGGQPGFTDAPSSTAISAGTADASSRPMFRAIRARSVGGEAGAGQLLDQRRAWRTDPPRGAARRHNPAPRSTSSARR